MTTGLHTVRDIHCGKCKQTLGWKYVSYVPPLGRVEEKMRRGEGVVEPIKRDKELI